MKSILNLAINSLFEAIFLIFFFIILFCIILKIFKKSSNNKTNLKFCKQKKATTILITAKHLSYDKNLNPFNKNISLIDLQKKLLDILDNKKITKIIIDVNNCNFTNTQVDELYPIFKKLNKEKEVIAIGTIMDNSQYLTALLADKIYLENTVNSTLILRGYYRKLCYLKGLFDKIGIEFKVIHIGDYKAAGENFAKTSMSDTLKENLSNLFENRLKQFIDFVKERRNVDITKDLLEGKLFFGDNSNLIDKRINKGILLKNEKNILNISNYKIKEKKKSSKNVIAVISLEGEIKENALNYKQVEEKIDSLNKINNLKGLVIEINSPGGSAYDSSLIYTYIKENVNVPIYISMKDVCASGGYFIASTGKKMFANKSTITGSIGVVSIYPIMSKLTKKLGLHYDGLQKGKTVEYANLYEHLDFDTQDIIENHMKMVYKEFKSVVIKARHMSDRRLEPIAGGRVWNAYDAKKIGLIDDIKTLDEVIIELAKYLNLKDYKVVKIAKKFDIENFSNSKIPFLNYDSYLNVPLLLYDEKLI